MSSTTMSSSVMQKFKKCLRPAQDASVDAEPQLTIPPPSTNTNMNDDSPAKSPKTQTTLQRRPCKTEALSSNPPTEEPVTRPADLLSTLEPALRNAIRKAGLSEALQEVMNAKADKKKTDRVAEDLRMDEEFRLSRPQDDKAQKRRLPIFDYPAELANLIPLQREPCNKEALCSHPPTEEPSTRPVDHKSTLASNIRDAVREAGLLEALGKEQAQDYMNAQAEQKNADRIAADLRMDEEFQLSRPQGDKAQKRMFPLFDHPAELANLIPHSPASATFGDDIHIEFEAMASEDFVLSSAFSDTSSEADSEPSSPIYERSSASSESEPSSPISERSSASSESEPSSPISERSSASSDSEPSSPISERSSASSDSEPSSPISERSSASSDFIDCSPASAPSSPVSELSREQVSGSEA